MLFFFAIRISCKKIVLGVYRLDNLGKINEIKDE